MSVRMIKDVLRARDIEGHCPLCGREKAKASHTDEHIFPLWLQHHHNLLNCRLTIPNLIGRKYKAVKIGICDRCNNKTFSRLEGRISRALTSSHPFVEANGLDRNEVAAWIGKIIWLLARKSHSDRDPRTRHKARPEGVLPSLLLSRLLYAGMLVRCLARSKKMLACHADQLTRLALLAQRLDLLGQPRVDNLAAHGTCQGRGCSVDSRWGQVVGLGPGAVADVADSLRIRSRTRISFPRPLPLPLR